MASISINESIWEALSDDEQKEVTDHLRKFRVLGDSENIVGDSTAPDGSEEGWLDDLNPGTAFCKIACDAAAAAALAALTLTGPLMVAATAAIGVARQACRNSC